MAKNKTVKFKCVGGKCKAPLRVIHLGKKGNMIDLQAVNTDVVLKFSARSPFDTKQVSISDGDTRTKEVENHGIFAYSLSCTKCKRRGPKSATPPQFIVP